MCAQDSHTFFQRFFSNEIHCQTFSHVVGIYLISRLQAFALFNDFFQIAVACCFCLLHHFCDTFPFCLAGTHKGFIFLAKIKNFCFITVFFPSIFCFHVICLLYFHSSSILLQLSLDCKAGLDSSSLFPYNKLTV